MNMDLTIKELQRIFKFFNDRLFDGTLQQPVILVQTNGKHKHALGWCTTKKVWSDRKNENSFYEITMCAEYLNRSIEQLVATLIHEMVHLYNLQNEIKDVSRGGTYHNKKFKEIAESKGLIISYDKRIGWSLTQLQDSTKAMIQELKPAKDLFNLARTSPFVRTDNDGEDEDGEVTEKPKSSMRKYVCPDCGTIIRATKDVNVLCGDCKIPFELEEK